MSSRGATAGIAVGSTGLIPVDATLKSRSHPDVRANGDTAAADMACGRLRGARQSTLPTNAYVADAVARDLRGRGSGSRCFHRPVSPGRNDAVIQCTRASNSPGPVLLDRAGRAQEHLMARFRRSRRMNVSVQLSQRRQATHPPAPRPGRAVGRVRASASSSGRRRPRRSSENRPIPRRITKNHIPNTA